jgi:hypothetical protein
LLFKKNRGIPYYIHFCLVYYYCCARAENKNEAVKQHTCFKNWTGSSGSMEQDIILEGFRITDEMHHLRYKRFIADGDVTVHANIQERVSHGSEASKKKNTTYK